MVKYLFSYQHPLKSWDERTLTCVVSFANNADFDDFMVNDTQDFTARIFVFLETKYGSLQHWTDHGHVDFSEPQITDDSNAGAVELSF